MTITTNNGATNGDDYVLFGVTMTGDEPGYFSDDAHLYAAGLFSPNYPLPAIPIEVDFSDANIGYIDLWIGHDPCTHIYFVAE